MKQVYLIMGIIALMSCFTGFSNAYAAFQEHGMAGVNYGQVIFPLLLCIFSFLLFKKKS